MGVLCNSDAQQDQMPSLEPILLQHHCVLQTFPPCCLIATLSFYEDGKWRVIRLERYTGCPTMFCIQLK